MPNVHCPFPLCNTSHSRQHHGTPFLDDVQDSKCVFPIVLQIVVLDCWGFMFYCIYIYVYVYMCKSYRFISIDIYIYIDILMRFCEPHTGKTKIIEICILSSFNPHCLTSFNLHPVSWTSFNPEMMIKWRQNEDKMRIKWGFDEEMRIKWGFDEEMGIKWRFDEEMGIKWG